jgi:hypothetical protein
MRSIMAGAFLARNVNEGMPRFWPVEDLAELADGPTGVGGLRGVAVYLLVTRSIVLTEAEKRQ